MMENSAFHPEQDTPNTHPDGDALPTYEDLATQKGPNSRFGRWRGWVEKRAAERYLDITPEDRARRRERGWGDDMDEQTGHGHGPGLSTNVQLALENPHPQWQADEQVPRHISSIQQEPPSYSIDDLDAPLPNSGEPLLPTRLMLHNFGSRFLPHTTSQIRTVLPLLGDRFLLIGHDEGLSVLDMIPSGNPETSGPPDAEIHAIWEGEGVYQLDLLEFQDTGDLTPHGVVLALVGGDVDSPHCKDDSLRTIRMYNLASLTSLARWASAQKQGTPPLDLRRPRDWNPQSTTSKKHKHHSSIARGFRGFIVEQPVNPSEPSASYQNIGPPQLPQKSKSFTPLRRGGSNATLDTSWDMVDDLPLRWATNYVPLASNGSRLSNTSVLFFELKRDENAGYRGPATLAVATKNSILLYETSKGERAFRFTKEFYTPLQPRGLTFVQQTISNTVLVRSPSASSSRSIDNMESRRFSIRSPNSECSRDRLMVSSSSTDFSGQLSLFVVFEKKAGLIRLIDAAVGEVELFEEGSTSPIAVSPRRPKSSLEAFGFARDPKGQWIPPVHASLPVPLPGGQVRSQEVYFVTRGRQTHILQCPLLIPISNHPPLKVLTWLSPPGSISQRVCTGIDGRDFLQIVGFGEFGVEVQEVSLSFLAGRGPDKGKGRVIVEDVLRAQADVGGDAGFMCSGGQWHKPLRLLGRSDSVTSYSTMSTLGISDQGYSDAGFYGWCRKDTQDWRVFWLGGFNADGGVVTRDL